MKTLNEQEQKVLVAAIQYYQNHINSIITQFYLDDDKSQVVSEFLENRSTIDGLYNTFSDDSDLFILTREDLNTIKHDCN